MNDTSGAKFYPPIEEKINIASHAFGLLLSVMAFFVLIRSSLATGNRWNIVIFGIFGLSLVLLYATSTIYHSATEPKRRKKLRIVDHAMIYVLIAGSYTPLALVTLKGALGWTIFSASWGMAITGITLKIFFTGRYSVFSTLMYVFMGWLIVFAIDPLIRSLPLHGLYWLLAGGLAYTVGAILYAIKRIPFNHAIFHMFVLVGSAGHFICIYLYVLPAALP